MNDDPTYGKERSIELERRAISAEGELAEANATIQYLRMLVDESGPTWMRGRCPSCGHRMAYAASGCPQCPETFKSPWHYNEEGEFPEDCECGRCIAVRAGTEMWTDPMDALV